MSGSRSHRETKVPAVAHGSHISLYAPAWVQSRLHPFHLFKHWNNRLQPFTVRTSPQCIQLLVLLQNPNPVVTVCVCCRSVLSDSVWLQDCSPPGSSVHGILQARILEWVAIPFSRGPYQPRDQTHVSYIGRRILYHLSHHQEIQLLPTTQNVSRAMEMEPSCFVLFPILFPIATANHSAGDGTEVGERETGRKNLRWSVEQRPTGTNKQWGP